MIHIAVVEENWFNLLEALDDGEYDEPDEDETCRVCLSDPCRCDDYGEDENLEAAVNNELLYGGEQCPRR